MAARRDPRKILKTILAETKRLDAKRFDRETGKFDKAEERRIRAAIKRLDKNFKDLKQFYFPWEFGRPK